MPHTCFIIGASTLAGDYPTPQAGDLVIAADGGWKHAAELGWTCDIIIGDFDSSEPPDGSPSTILRLPREKDDTDMSAAITIGLEHGCDTFWLLAGTQGRLDHTLANIQSLADLAQRGRAAFLPDADATLTALHDGTLTLDSPSDALTGTVSVFAHGDAAPGVTLSGLKYPLQNATLVNTRALGVSNELMGRPARIRVGKGTLIVVFPGAIRPIFIRNGT